MKRAPPANRPRRATPVVQPSAEHAALALREVAVLMAPLALWLLRHGVSFPVFAEALKPLFVEDDQRSYLTVAIGCTGGQHRSVYCVEMLARRFEGRHATLLRHRELDARD